MPRPKSEDTIRNVRAVAYLLVAGQTPGDIAHRLGISLARVAQLKREAESTRLLEVPRPVLGSEWTADVQRAVDEFLGGDFIPDLTRLLKDASKLGILTPPLDVHVFPAASTGDDWDGRLEHFGRLCAPLMRDLLSDHAAIGVSWGATLGAVVRGLERLPTQVRPPGSIVPICGEPLSGLPKEFSATELAARLATRLDGSRQHWRSLHAVPFLIPLDFTRQQRDAIFALAKRSGGYKEIFVRGLANRLPVLLTSVGLEGHPFGQGGAAFLREAGLTPARMELLRASVVADISGILLRKRGISPKATHLLDQIEDRWTGISLAQVAACARRARESERGGVVVAAIGRAKASVVLECMMREGGLISHLVIDHDLEEELRRKIRALLAGIV